MVHIVHWFVYYRVCVRLLLCCMFIVVVDFDDMCFVEVCVCVHHGLCVGDD